MSRTSETGNTPPGMALIHGGVFVMGSNDFYPEERPAHPVKVSPFLLDRAPVTVAERRPAPEDYPGADLQMLVPGALVFTGADRPVSLNDPTRWWSWVPGASCANLGDPVPTP